MKSPWKICLILWICLAGVGLVRYADRPGQGDESIAELASPDSLASLDSLENIDSLENLDSPETIESLATIEEEVVEIAADSTVAPLANFFAALEGADTVPVRVVHYGDSQIEEDRITCVLRRYLQEQYGGGGVGLIPVLQTIPTRTLRQRLVMNGTEQTASCPIVRYRVYGPANGRRPDSRVYGPMGQLTCMNDSMVAGSEAIKLSVTQLNGAVKTRPFNRVRMWSDGDITLRTLAGRSSRSRDSIYLSGRGEVYGLSLETDTGVIVDNIPMRGSLGTIFTNMDARSLRDFYRETNTRLIILQYGGNFLSGVENDRYVRGAVQSLGEQVRYLRRIAPEASILFVGPSDMLTYREGERVSNPYVDLMDRLLAGMAQREHIAYFSAYRAMGGEGSMKTWQERGWAGDDGIHFTQRGADKMGEMIWEAMNDER